MTCHLRNSVVYTHMKTLFREYIQGRSWYVFTGDSDLRQTEVMVNNDIHETVGLGDYFYAQKLQEATYKIELSGNTDFDEGDVIRFALGEDVLEKHESEEDALEAAHSVFGGYPSPEGGTFKREPSDRLRDIGQNVHQAGNQI